MMILMTETEKVICKTSSAIGTLMSDCGYVMRAF
jgi:hypothetical protein